MSILRSESLTRTYPSGGRELTVLRDITFELSAGEILAITGPSGSGKSTLLGLLAGLDRPTSGRVLLDGHDLSSLSEDERAELRASSVGFVFQSFHLIPTLTARENVEVPLELRGEDPRGRGGALLERVGLGDRGHHYPAQPRAANSSASRWRAPS
jgi:putative ABC transport system ATP-binding protein